MRHPLGPILGRVAAVIGVVMVIGIILRLLLAILTPILPGTTMQALTAGWGLFYGIVSPALPAVIAVGILLAISWIITMRK